MLTIALRRGVRARPGCTAALTRCGAPSQGLLVLTDKCSSGFAAVQAGEGAAAEAPLRALLADFVTFRDSMCGHLLEEEQVGLPLLRHHFSAKEFKAVEEKIVAHATPADVAWVLRPFPSDDAKRAWMTGVAKMPGFIASLVMFPAIRRYNRDVVVPMAALRAGDTVPPPVPDAGCACSVM